MATVWPAQGTTIAVDEVSGATNAYTLINSVVSIGSAGGSTITQARTSSLASLVHTYRGTIPDPAEVTFSCNFDPTDAAHKFIRNLADNPQNGPNSYLVSFNTTNTNSDVVFSGNVSELNGLNADDVEANLMADFSIKRSGANTWNAAT